MYFSSTYLNTRLTIGHALILQALCGFISTVSGCAELYYSAKSRRTLGPHSSGKLAQGDRLQHRSTKSAVRFENARPQNLLYLLMT